MAWQIKNRAKVEQSASGFSVRQVKPKVQKTDTWFVGLFANPSIKRAGRAKMGVKRGPRRTKKSEKVKKSTANDPKNAFLTLF